MGVEEIIARIGADAAAEADRILREAADEEGRIRRDGEAAAVQAYAAIRDAGGREAAGRCRKIHAKAHLAARTEIRNAREDGIALCFGRARRELSALPATPAYAGVLQRLIAEGQEIVGPGDVGVLYREEDEAAVCEALTVYPDIVAALLREEATDRGGGGIVVTCQSHRCDQRFSARCERMRERLTRETARILYGNDE